MSLMEAVKSTQPNEPEVQMQKLLNSYAKNPTEVLRNRIKIYHRKHSFSIMFLTAKQNEVLKEVLK